MVTAMKMFSTLSRLDEFFMDLSILFFEGRGGLRCSKYSITLLKSYLQFILKYYLWQRKSKQSIRGIIFQDGYPHCCHGTQLWKSTADTQEFYIKGLKPPKNYILLFSIRTHLRELQTRNSKQIHSIKFQCNTIVL